MKEKPIEPCEFCKTKYAKEMCKIANKFLNDEEPCYCRTIKRIQRLIKENKKLKILNTDYFCFLMEHDDMLSAFEEWKEEEKEESQ